MYVISLIYTYSTKKEEWTSSKKPDKAGDLQREVLREQAPREVDRVDKANYNGKPHVHFKDVTSINFDGTIHDKHKGVPNITNKIEKWLNRHNWKGRL